MEKRLVRSKWFASLLIFFCGLVHASDVAEEGLQSEDLNKPEIISSWLKVHAKTADRKKSNSFLELAKKSEKTGRWSSAAKAFAESALHFPTPVAFIGRADNLLRMLSITRASKKETSKYQSDLEWAIATYRSALAAEEQLKMLSAQDLAQLKADEACLDAYLKAPRWPIPKDAACRPLRLYATSFP